MAISYAMSSAEKLFQESLDRSLEPKQEIKSDGKQKYRLSGRKSHKLYLMNTPVPGRPSAASKMVLNLSG
jgi:hypothetical protein